MHPENYIFIHKFDNVTTIGLLLMLVIIFSSQAVYMLKRLHKAEEGTANMSGVRWRMR